jgi:hypothetical protein
MALACVRIWSCVAVASATLLAPPPPAPPPRHPQGYLALHTNRSRDGALSCDEICADHDFQCDADAAEEAGRSQQAQFHAFEDVGIVCDAWFPIRSDLAGGEYPLVYEDEYSGPIAVRNESLRTNGTYNGTPWTMCLLAGTTAPPPICSAVYDKWLDIADQLCFCKDVESPPGPPPAAPPLSDDSALLGVVIGTSVGALCVCVVGLVAFLVWGSRVRSYKEVE